MHLQLTSSKHCQIFFIALFLSMPAAHSDTTSSACNSSPALSFETNSMRIERPRFRMPSVLQFSSGREVQVASQFMLWSQHYRQPVMCSSVMCGGSCGAYTDSCPSFTGLSVLNFSRSSSIVFGGSSISGCPVNVPDGLVASNGCGAYLPSAASQSAQTAAVTSCSVPTRTKQAGMSGCCSGSK
jgi:hypothetical protein